MNLTRIKLIEAAEQEFAENGFRSASIRAITARAGANIAAVNYHFGTKEKLFIEMIRYRLSPLNTVRITLLKEAAARAGTKPLQIRTIIEALIRPLLQQFASGPKASAKRYFIRAMARGMEEEASLKKSLYEDILAEINEVVRQEIGRTLSDLPKEVPALCFAYLRSTMSGVMQLHNDPCSLQTGIKFPDSDSLVAFLAGGIESIAADYREQSK